MRVPSIIQSNVMTYISIALEAHTKNIGRIESLLHDRAALFTSISPIHDEETSKTSVNPVFEYARINSYLPLQTDVEELNQVLRKLASRILDLGFVADQDWVKAWQHVDDCHSGASSAGFSIQIEQRQTLYPQPNTRRSAPFSF